jgi:phosphatidylglycerol---prolipoprotein diacylglyceryl transferase
MKKFIIPFAVTAGLALVYFVFIPAFAGRLTIPPVIQIGPVFLRWYGLILAASILIGYIVARRFSWRFGIARIEIDNFAFWLTVVSFVGARLYFVVFAYEYFLRNPNEIYRIWNGGLSIYGALIAGIIFTFIWTQKKAYSAKQLLDLLALSLPLAQAFGRLGNFVNQEAFGRPTDVPWKMYVSPEYRPQAFAELEFYHPAFLYESLLMVAVFFILRKLLGRLEPGVLAFCYLGFYSLIRFFIEPIRLDSVWLGTLRADQVVALIMVMVAGLFILRWQFAKRKPAADIE